MKKNKVNNMVNTIPLKDIFSDKVFIDVDNGVLYDLDSKLAIGYMSALTDSIVIIVKTPELLDEDFKKVKQDVITYFNNKVFEHLTHELYFHAEGGYVKIGEVKAGVRAELKVPRIYMNCDAAPVDEADDEEEEEFDPEDMDPEEFATDLDDFIEDLIH